MQCVFWLEQFFSGAEKRVKPCVVRSSFSTALLQQQKKKGWPDNPGFLQQKRGSHIICFWVYFLQKGFLIDQIQMTVFG